MLSSESNKLLMQLSADVLTIQSIKGIEVNCTKSNINLKEKMLKLYDLDEVSPSQKQYKQMRRYLF
jgi:hypothetical protein